MYLKRSIMSNNRYLVERDLKMIDLCQKCTTMEYLLSCICYMLDGNRRVSTEEPHPLDQWSTPHLQTSVILLQEGATMPISRAMSPFRSSNAFSSASSSSASTPLGSMENSAMLFRYLINANWNMLKYHHYYHHDHDHHYHCIDYNHHHHHHLKVCNWGHGAIIYHLLCQIPPGQALGSHRRAEVALHYLSKQKELVTSLYAF